MSSTFSERLQNLLAVVPVIILWTLVNVLISFVLSIVAFIQLVAVYGVDKRVSMGVAVLIAIAVHLYIWGQPKIRRYISARSQ
jgi:hypothetical protein